MRSHSVAATAAVATISSSPTIQPGGAKGNELPLRVPAAGGPPLWLGAAAGAGLGLELVAGAGLGEVGLELGPAGGGVLVGGIECGGGLAPLGCSTSVKVLTAKMLLPPALFWVAVTLREPGGPAGGWN